MILGIETSGARCAVALVGGVLADGALLGGPLARRARVVRRIREMERGHAEALFPMLDEALDEAGVSWRALSRIGVCTGPGSFTGIRVGIAAARGLALGLGIPSVGIGRLEALAADAAPGRAAAVRVPGPGGAFFLQEFGADGQSEGPPRLVGGEVAAFRDRVLVGPGGALPHGLPDPAVIAGLAAGRPPGQRPAPLYLRDAGAAPPREASPPLLDP